MRSPTRWVALLGLAVIVLSSCRRKDASEIRIGALLPLSGEGSNYGRSLQNGLELALEDINGAGGINGRPLRIVYEDSQGDAKTGISAFNKLTTIDHVPLVVASISSVVLAVTPLADSQRVLLINSSAMSPRICDQATQYLFSFMVSGADEAAFMAKTFTMEHPNTPIAILYSNNASGLDTKNRFETDLAALHGAVGIEEAYNLGTTDFRTQLTKIKSSGARFGYLLAFSSTEFAQILRQAQELGISIQWYSYSGFETQDTISFAGSSANGILYSYPSYAGQEGAFGQLQSRYQTRFHALPDIYTVTSFDALKVIATALATSSATDADTLRSTIRSTRYTGIFGPVRFSSHQCVDRPLMWKTVDSGHFLPLPPTRGRAE